MAVADKGHAVSIFRKETKYGARREVQGTGEAVERLAVGPSTVQWVQLGRCQAHHKEIICEFNKCY
jgi:hypothetical protein